MNSGSLDGWLPLGGRWLRYAALGLAGTVGLGLLLVSAMVGGPLNGLALVALTVWACWPSQEAPPADADWTPFGVFLAATFGPLMTVWLFGLAPEVMSSLHSECGTYRNGMMETLTGMAPLGLAVPLAGCRLARGSRGGGVAARCLTLPGVGLWIIILAGLVIFR